MNLPEVIIEIDKFHRVCKLKDRNGKQPGYNRKVEVALLHDTTNFLLSQIILYIYMNLEIIFMIQFKLNKGINHEVLMTSVFQKFILPLMDLRPENTNGHVSCKQKSPSINQNQSKVLNLHYTYLKLVYLIRYRILVVCPLPYHLKKAKQEKLLLVQ